MKQEILYETRNMIDDIYKNGINENNIRQLYRLLGNKSIPLAFTNSNNTASFSPKFMYISVNSEKLDKWIDDMINESLKHFDISNTQLLKSYLAVYVLYHEIEHSNQSLISKGIKTPNYDYESYAYHDIMDVIFAKKYLLPRPISLTRDIIRFIIYKINAYDFILERNASIEGYNMASRVANISNDKEMLNYFISSRNLFMLQGYLDGDEGCLKHTYRKLGMMRKYNKLVFPNDMPLEERSRKGIELSQEEREKVVLSLRQSIHFK